MGENDSRRRSYWFNFVYIFIIQGLGSGIVAGGIEFAIAYGMYWKQPFPVTLWAFPNTLSGDCALSLFIQVGVNWLLMEIFIGYDCFRSRSPLLPRKLLLPDQKSHRLVWYYFEIEHGVSKDGQRTIANYLRRQFLRDPGLSKLHNIVNWIFWKFIVSMTAAIALWAVVWPVTMGILAGIGTRVGSHDYQFHGWTPQITKLIFAFVLGLLSSPAAIIVILIRDEWFTEYSQQCGGKTDTNEKFEGVADDERHGSASVNSSVSNDDLMPV